MQTQPRSITAPSRHERPDLAFTIEGWIPSHKKPQCLLRTYGKRPDDLTIIPWRDGRCATWHVTVTDTSVASYLSLTSSCAGLAADAADTREE